MYKLATRSYGWKYQQRPQFYTIWLAFKRGYFEAALDSTRPWVFRSVKYTSLVEGSHSTLRVLSVRKPSNSTIVLVQSTLLLLYLLPKLSNHTSLVVLSLRIPLQVLFQAIWVLS
jgi:hypothetical protein